MTFETLLGGACPIDLADRPVEGLTLDSRKVVPGGLFIAVQGAAADGHDFIADAAKRGAALAITERPVEAEIPSVAMPDARAWLAKAAAKFYARQPACMVAITGTNGKSSSVDFLRQIWSHAGLSAASMGTLGVVGQDGTVDLGHTTPDPVAIHQTLCDLSDRGVEHCAMEASSHGLAQHRLDGVKLSAVAFTNFTQDHLDFHPTMAAYRDAKLRLFRDLAPAGIPAIVNADCDARDDFESAAERAGLKVFSVGWRGQDLKILELMPRPTGQRMTLKWDGAEHRLDLPLIGEFQALNALTAGALALALGLEFEAVCAGLGQLQPVKGRLEYVGEGPGGSGVFVDYAHTPDGLDTLLRAARPHTRNRLIVVFGCGGDRDATKRPLMGAAVAKHADVAIVTDDNPRTESPAAIRAAILAGVPHATEIGDRAEAIRAGIDLLTPGDTLLIAGKGHETGQILADRTIPFSDQDTAAAALKEAYHV